MAERTHAARYPVGPPEVAAPTAGLRRISWSAVLAGAAMVAAIHLSLSLLGFGIGMSTVDPAAGGSPQASSIGSEPEPGGDGDPQRAGGNAGTRARG
jgi:hypothetical protein